MAVIKYRNVPVRVSKANGAAGFYYAPASSITVSMQNKLEASRVLGVVQPNNFRIGGEINTKIGISFVACNRVKDSDSNSTYNLASGVLVDLTGFSGTTIYVGGNVYNSCYLEGVSVEIVPFAPLVISADFACMDSPEGESFVVGDFGITEDLNNYVAYGYNTQITNGTNLSDSSRESISYKISCGRSYTASIGQINPNNVFLNSIDKELTIKSHNIGKFIDYSGYGEMISFNPKNNLGVSIVGGGFGMSANCKIIAQNLTMGDGDILQGDISLREVIL
jgi:hypothetical protein